MCIIRTNDDKLNDWMAPMTAFSATDHSMCVKYAQAWEPRKWIPAQKAWHDNKARSTWLHLAKYVGPRASLAPPQPTYFPSYYNRFRVKPGMTVLCHPELVCLRPCGSGSRKKNGFRVKPGMT